MLTGILDKLFGFKTLAIAAAIAFALGAASGWSARDYIADYATAKRDLADRDTQIANLQAQLNAQQEASAYNSSQAILTQAQLQRMKDAFRDLEARISDGDCFGRADLDELQKGWR